jgi:hypothetical protein
MRISLRVNIALGTIGRATHIKPPDKTAGLEKSVVAGQDLGIIPFL